MNATTSKVTDAGGSQRPAGQPTLTDYRSLNANAFNAWRQFMLPEHLRPGKGAGKGGRTSRSTIMPSGAAATVAVASLAHLGESVDPARAIISEAALSWGLVLAEFFTGVRWSAAFNLAAAAFI